MSGETRNARYRGRTALNAALTIAVLTLLAISFASIGRTSAYTLVRSDTRARADLGAVRAYVAAAGFTDRVRIVLRAVRTNAATNEAGVPYGYEIRRTGYDLVKSAELAAQAAVFAGFGLVVLWWGRDRTSLWLGVACAALAPYLLTVYAFVPEPLMLACRLAAGMLTFLAFYALYAMAEAVAVGVLRSNDPVRGLLVLLRGAVVAIVVAGAAADAATLLLPVTRGIWLAPAIAAAGKLATQVSWSVVFCLLPLALLGVAALRAATADGAKRARLILLTTLAGLSGIAFSIVHELARGGMPHFETIWFTLLLIPTGFFLLIRAFGVIDVQFIVSRLLVVTAMTLIVGVAITLVEMLVHGTAEEWLKSRNEGEQLEFNAALQFVVGFVIVVIFGTVHERIDEALEKLVFRDRDRALARLHTFSVREAALFTTRAGLLARAASLVHETLAPSGAAVYEATAGRFTLAASAGPRRWHPSMAPDAVHDDASVFPMAVADRVMGMVVVSSRAGDADADYDAHERRAIAEAARSCGEVLMSLSISGLAAFVTEIADGRLAASDARARAADLRAFLAAADA